MTLRFDDILDNVVSKDSPIVSKIIDKTLEQKHTKEAPRGYLGASVLSGDCDRQKQYVYANVAVDDDKGFSGRILRTFAIGHSLEKLIIDQLLDAGFELLTRNKTGLQIGFSLENGAIKGHVDGIITKMPKELENREVPALWECKTMKSSLFRKVVEGGILNANISYARQMSFYMYNLDKKFPGLLYNPALLTVINKDTSELYNEFFYCIPKFAKEMLEVAKKIIQTTTQNEPIEDNNLMDRLTNDPSYYKCRFCNYKKRCFTND